MLIYLVKIWQNKQLPAGEDGWKTLVSNAFFSAGLSGIFLREALSGRSLLGNVMKLATGRYCW